MRVKGLLLGLSMLVASMGMSQYALPQNTCTRTHSGQFFISDQRSTGSLSQLAARFRTNQSYIILDPTLLAVSCERIKQEVSDRLCFAGPWQGRIGLTLSDAFDLSAPLTITSGRFRDGWNYGLQLPDVVSKESYLRVMVQVLTAELANRNAAERTAEVPRWLIEGLTKELLLSRSEEILLPPPQKQVNGLTLLSANVMVRRESPLETARKELRTRPPLTFNELSWPAEQWPNPESSEHYALSSQLFLNEILNLNDGKARMRQMICDLPKYYNWQFAFLHEFQTNFPNLIAVEKWWTLRALRFIGRDANQASPLQASWSELDESLSPSVQVRLEANELPLQTRVTLQAIIQQWQPEEQRQVLLDRLAVLTLLRLRVAPQLASLLNDYCETINTYLVAREKGGLLRKFRKAKIIEESETVAVKRLDELDTRREALRPSDKTLTTAKLESAAKVSEGSP